MAKALLIAAVAGSFFRCGRQFTTEAVTVSQDEFTEDQWSVLAAEPRLHIRPAPDGAEPQPGASEALAEALKAAIATLEEGDFGKDGKPKLEALKERLPELKAQITASARDEVWATLLPRSET